MSSFNKIVYRILLCDDNRHFLNELYSLLYKSVSKCDDFTLNIDIATQRGEIISKIRDNTYDLITLDVCYNNNSNSTPMTYYENLRTLVNDGMYGAELYMKEIKNIIDPALTKVIIVSNLDVDTMRRNFNYDTSLDYFYKRTNSPSVIAKHIVNFFITNKKSLYNDVFVVYGHNTSMRNEVERHLHTLNLCSIDLYHSSTGGLNSFIDSLTDVANSSQCAIILLSADDITLDIQKMKLQYRARPNVIFEMGLFLGKLGKDRILAIHEKHEFFEFPSDIQGVFYIEYDKSKPDSWKTELDRRLRKIGFGV